MQNLLLLSIIESVTVANLNTNRSPIKESIDTEATIIDTEEGLISLILKKDNHHSTDAVLMAAMATVFSSYRKALLTRKENFSIFINFNKSFINNI